MVIHVRPKSWFTQNCDLQQDGQTIAELRFGAWRSDGHVRIGTETYRVYREHFLSGDFVLSSATGVVARAAKPSAWRNTFLVAWAGKTYELRKTNVFRREFSLFSGAQCLGTLRPQSAWTRRAELDWPQDLPMPLQAFMVWLVWLIWIREATAAATWFRRRESPRHFLPRAIQWTGVGALLSRLATLPTRAASTNLGCKSAPLPSAMSSWQ